MPGLVPGIYVLAIEDIKTYAALLAAGIDSTA